MRRLGAAWGTLRATKGVLKGPLPPLGQLRVPEPHLYGHELTSGVPVGRNARQHLERKVDAAEHVPLLRAHVGGLAAFH